MLYLRPSCPKHVETFSLWNGFWDTFLLRMPWFTVKLKLYISLPSYLWVCFERSISLTFPKLPNYLYEVLCKNGYLSGLCVADYMFCLITISYTSDRCHTCCVKLYLLVSFTSSINLKRIKPSHSPQLHAAPHYQEPTPTNCYLTLYWLHIILCQCPNYAISFLCTSIFFLSNNYFLLPCLYFINLLTGFPHFGN